MWSTFHKNAIDGIDETERLVDSTWVRALAAIVAWELFLRRRTVSRARSMPIVDGGWIHPQELGAFRRALRVDLDRARDRLREQLYGSTNERRLAVAGDPAGAGITPRALRQAEGVFDGMWRRLEAIRTEFERRAAEALRPKPRDDGPPGRPPLLPPTSGPTNPVPPRGVTPRQLAEIERQIARLKKKRKRKVKDDEPIVGEDPPKPKKRDGDDPYGIGELPPPRKVEDDPFGFEGEQLTPGQLEQIEEALRNSPEVDADQRARAVSDLLDVGQDAVLNIARHLDFELERVMEAAIRVSGPLGRLESFTSWLDGSPTNLSSQPWQMNRNNLRLSTVAHLRAIHRRRTISEGIASGVAHYRLDVPTARLGQVSAGGTLAPHLWQVRTLKEWADITDTINARRSTPTSFDTLGLVHNDPSYVIAVPSVFLRDAIESGRRLRSRYGLDRKGVIRAA